MIFFRLAQKTVLFLLHQFIFALKCIGIVVVITSTQLGFDHYLSAAVGLNMILAPGSPGFVAGRVSDGDADVMGSLVTNLPFGSRILGAYKREKAGHHT